MKFKQIILIRTDIEMSCGKKCVQVSHASLMACDKADSESGSCSIQRWKEEGMRKIVLKVQSLYQLRYIAQQATKFGIVWEEVCDFGLTQVEPNTVTAIGFEPLEDISEKGKVIGELTKELKLL